MGIVSAIPEKCKRCYVCVRECPARAIKVEKGQALVIRERCIACGNCVKVCSQKAKRIQDDTGHVREMLRNGKRVFACLAPSFPAAFHSVAPGKVIAAARRLGFHEVWSVAFGAELVAAEYVKLYEQAKRSRSTVIATPCPALVSYVEKYLPELRPSLAPVVSPMIATARAIRARHGEGVRVVFIGPCIAKKNEVRDPCVDGSVDVALTFPELEALFMEEGVDPARLKETDFDGPPFATGGSFALSGGLLRTAGAVADILDNDVVVAEGKDRALLALRELAEGLSQARFLDILFCEGCISGPQMPSDPGRYARKEAVARYVNEVRVRVQPGALTRALTEFRHVSLHREFSPEDLVLRLPSEEAIEAALRQMHKLQPADHLNCGACGYPTCREKAIAVCQGLAEASMCLPYLIDELENTLAQLEEAQQRLVQTERMASMGQLSAGVAHEINNPLGTILIYAHMLLRRVQQGHPHRADLEMIVNEATRCKTIVRGLLDFARQSRVTKLPTDLPPLIRDVVAIMSARATERRIRLRADLPDNFPVLMLDADQVKQMLVNLVSNAIDACAPDAGDVVVRAEHRPDARVACIEVADNGTGISEENLPRVFQPFFTTKELGKGTGLGLAICYGIVKMHSGDIAVHSQANRGTTFSVTLPSPPLGD